MVPETVNTFVQIWEVLDNQHGISTLFIAQMSFTLQSPTSLLSLELFLQESPEHNTKSTRRLCFAFRNFGEAPFTILLSWAGSFFTLYSSTKACSQRRKMTHKKNVCRKNARGAEEVKPESWPEQTTDRELKSDLCRNMTKIRFCEPCSLKCQSLSPSAKSLGN